MQRPEELGVEAKWKVLIRHLVLCFPHTAILSRQVGDRYHVFVIAPFDGGPEKTIQVERAVLVDPQPTEDNFRRLLESLRLPPRLQICGRYDLRQVSGLQSQHAPTQSVISGDTATPACCPAANGEWPATPIGDTVFHGPLPLSGSSLATPPGAWFSLRAD